MKHIPCDAGAKVVKAKNAHKEILVTVAFASEKILSFQMMTPTVPMHVLSAEQHDISTSYFKDCSNLMFQRTFSKCDITLPIYLPVGQTAAEIQLYPNNWLDKFSYILSKSATGTNQSQNHFCR